MILSDGGIINHELCGKEKSPQLLTHSGRGFFIKSEVKCSLKFIAQHGYPNFATLIKKTRNESDRDLFQKKKK